MNEFSPQRELLSKRVNHTITALIATLGIMIVVLSVSFIFLVSSSGQKGYELKQLQLANDHLQSQNESLKRQLTETLSYQQLENTEKVKKMENPEDKTYITSKKIPN